MVTLQHHIPLGAQQGGGGVRLCPDLQNHPPASPSPQGTFCLLSSRCTCSTKRLSLRLLTEIPEGEGQRSGIKVRAGASRRSPGLWLTRQVGVINPLLDFGILHDDHSVGRQ